MVSHYQALVDDLDVALVVFGGFVLVGAVLLHLPVYVGVQRVWDENLNARHEHRQATRQLKLAPNKNALKARYLIAQATKGIFWNQLLADLKFLTE